MAVFRESARLCGIALVLCLGGLFALGVTEIAAGEEGDDTSSAEVQPATSPVRAFFNSSQYKWGMSWLNFGIVCFLFYRYARKPLLGLLDRRAEQVAEVLERSTKTKQEAEAALREATRQLAGVAHEKRRIVQLATEVGEKQRAAILEDAGRAADRVEKQLAADIERARYLARQRVVELLAGQAVDEAEQRIVGTITQEDQAALIERFIEQLDRSMVR
jgi:F-type H+-transporting ATPase subunit b